MVERHKTDLERLAEEAPSNQDHQGHQQKGTQP